MAVATVVTFPHHEPFIAVLRNRQLITDSPRLLAEDARDQRPANAGHTAPQMPQVVPEP
jgi:hypothetical protein